MRDCGHNAAILSAQAATTEMVMIIPNVTEKEMVRLLCVSPSRLTPYCIAAHQQHRVTTRGFPCIRMLKSGLISMKYMACTPAPLRARLAGPLRPLQG